MPPRPSGGQRRVELNARQRDEPNDAHCSASLAMLLEHLGRAHGDAMARLLLSMQREAAKDVCQLLRLATRSERGDTRELSVAELGALSRELDDAPEHDDDLPWGVSPSDLLLGRIDPRDEYVRAKAVQRLKRRLTVLAKGRFPLPGTHSVMACPDPSGSIPEGAVVFLVKGRPQVEPRMLLYKAPGQHPGDVRLTEAIARRRRCKSSSGRAGRRRDRADLLDGRRALARRHDRGQRL